MRITLEALKETGEKSQLELSDGKTLRVGRRAPSEFVCPDDSYMSGIHFEAEYRDGQCHISDLGSRNGTFLNGVQIQKAIAQDGDEISAGRTKFYVCIEKQTPTSESNANVVSAFVKSPATGVPQTADLSEVQNRLLKILQQQPAQLFAILDAARDDRILDLLRNSGEEYQSLYEGKQGEDLVSFAPYLVRIPGESVLLQHLVKEGWGKSWGIYLTCDKPFQDVRKHFRHFLLIRTEDGKELYFRFYDPRVLRVYLPTCTPEDTTLFWGPVQVYLVESQHSDKLLHLVDNGRDIEQTVLVIKRSTQSSTTIAPT